MTSLEQRVREGLPRLQTGAVGSRAHIRLMARTVLGPMVSEVFIFRTLPWTVCIGVFVYGGEDRARALAELEAACRRFLPVGIRYRLRVEHDLEGAVR